MADELIAAVAPVARRVRAYFAPVARAAGAATVFDPAGIAGFDLSAPVAPWIDLGWCSGFVRTSGTKVEALAGVPGIATGLVRTVIEASVALNFESWGKLQMALSCGGQQMNVLRTQADAAANGSGGVAVAAVPVGVGSTATQVVVGVAGQVGFTVGDLVAIDVDYGGETGFVGSGVSGGYVKSAAAILDVDYVRRVTLNVGRITAIAGGVLTLGTALLAGAPVTGMQVSPVVGFCDREGGSFFQEWSGVFVADGEQGDRVVFHYPRLQGVHGPAEVREELAGGGGGLAKLKLAGSFRALPVRDANDGELVVCFRSYLPGVMRAV